MPRPKSEITGSGKGIGMRMSAWEHETYMALGGNRWLRAFLKQKKLEMVKGAHQKSPLSLKEKA
jgi:hypothetical protein